MKLSIQDTRKIERFSGLLVPSNDEFADGVIPENNGKFKNSKSTNLTNHIGNISEITDNVYQGYLNDDVLVLEVEHTDGVLETGTSSDEGTGLTEHKIKKGEKKISARLHTQRKASKQVIRASGKTRRISERNKDSIYGLD